jgi:hypothetical protein
MSEEKPKNALKLIAIALSLYITWVAATYLLEGRIHLLQQVDPIGRMTYVAIANIAIGTVLSALAIRHLIRLQLIKPEQLGFNRSQLRTVSIVTLAAAGGLALFMLQNPKTTEPIVVFNAFMQVLPVSIAEVMVCWALIGSSFESLAKQHVGRVTSVVIGAGVASILFGVYHYAHSPPFNDTSVVLFLMLPSIATAVTYFLGRNIYAAIIVQNFLGIVGVLASLPVLEPFRQPMVPIYAMSAVSIAALVISVSVILRRTLKRTSKVREQSIDQKKTESRRETSSA